MFVYVREGVTHYSDDDPRALGFDGPVTEGVKLDYPEDVHRWADGAECKIACVGVSPSNDKLHHVFPSDRACHAAGFTYLTSSFTDQPADD